MTVHESSDRPNPRMIFVNLQVADLPRAVEFYAAIGLERDPRFSNDETAMMAFSDQIKFMLLTPARFAEFLAGPPATGTEVLVALSAGSREEVERVDAAARAAGAGSWLPPQDHGFMYGVSFTDPDGHVVEVVWMDVEAAFAGADAAAAAQA